MVAIGRSVAAREISMSVGMAGLWRTCDRRATLTAEICIPAKAGIQAGPPPSRGYIRQPAAGSRNRTSSPPRSSLSSRLTVPP